MTDQEKTPQPEKTVTNSSASLRMLIPVMIVLLVVAAFVYTLQPKPTVYVPGPDEVPKVKTAREIATNIEAVKANKDIPDSQKPRILGFLKAELDQAKARESGSATPPK